MQRCVLVLETLFQQAAGFWRTSPLPCAGRVNGGTGVFLAGMLQFLLWVHVWTAKTSGMRNAGTCQRENADRELDGLREALLNIVEPTQYRFSRLDAYLAARGAE